MANAGNSSSNVDKSQTSVKPQEKPSGSEDKSERALKIQVMIATITAITTILIAIINSETIIGWLFKPDPTAVPAATSTSSSTPFFTSTPIIFADTLSPVVLPSLTGTISITLTPSETPTLTPAPTLRVLVGYDKSAGKPPLKVNFDARDSYLIDSDGQQYPCRFGNCDFAWKVILDARQLEKSINDSSGRFQYTFGKRGTFLVIVWVCRGKDAIDCGGEGIYIVVG